MSNNKFKVLIVEDEANICSFIETLLTTNDYQALVAHTCTMGLTLFASHNPDLVILDLGLPDRDGLEFIRTVRQKYMTPIVVLSARTDEMDKIEALDLGANDYITKPFKLGVLLSRVHALLRRAGGFGAQQATELCSGGIRVDLLAGRAEKNGVPLELTAAEYKLLCLFLRSPGQVLTKETILNALWDCEGNYVDTNTLTVYIRRLRLKVEDDPGSPQRLVTVRGMGYRWNGDV